MIGRRAFTGGMIACIGGATLGCKPSVSRASVLRDLVQQVVLPDVQTIARQSHRLARDIDQLARAPDADKLEAARESLRHSMLAWQRAHAFRDGPMLETHALIRSTFWPIRRPAIAEAIRTSTRFDAARIEELGVDVKGVFALEHVLYEGPAEGSSWLSMPEAPVALAFASALADDVSSHAERALQAHHRGAFAESFARAGQTSLNRLVNQMLASMETIAADRLGRALARHASHGVRLQDIQGGPSGVSTELSLAWLTAMQSLFLGRDDRGLTALAKLAAPDIEPGVRAAFARAVDKLARVPKRLEQAVTPDPSALEQAIRAIKELEVTTKVDLIAALGISLSFVSTDGD